MAKISTGSRAYTYTPSTSASSSTTTSTISNVWTTFSAQNPLSTPQMEVNYIQDKLMARMISDVMKRELSEEKQHFPIVIMISRDLAQEFYYLQMNRSKDGVNKELYEKFMEINERYKIYECSGMPGFSYIIIDREMFSDMSEKLDPLDVFEMVRMK